MTANQDPRLPLNFKNGSSTFVIAASGLVLANLSPLVMSVLEDAGLTVTQSGNVLTITFLISAILGIVLAPLLEGKLRTPITAGSLLLATLAFTVGAFSTNPTMLTVSLIIGGGATGGMIAGSSSAIAALRNTNRISAASGLVNRIVVMTVFAIMPIIGIVSGTIYGTLAIFSFIGLLLVFWLPQAPKNAAPPATAAIDQVITNADVASERRTKFWGLLVLIIFPLWATCEESVYAMSTQISARVGMTDDDLSTALSIASAVGIFSMLFIIFLGHRIGRALPIGITMIVGGFMILGYGLVESPAAYQTLILVENGIYIITYSLFVAVAAGLDPRGKWSGPLIATYVIGSSFGPSIGAWVFDTFGVQALTTAAGICTVALAVPTILAARVSLATEKFIAQSKAPAETVNS